MSAITTHVLDTALGRPAVGLPVRLEHLVGQGDAKVGVEIGRASTDQDGRASDLGPAEVQPGIYRLVFDTAAYWRDLRRAEQPFFPEVGVTFAVRDPGVRYHVPLLLSPFGFSTYRGS